MRKELLEALTYIRENLDEQHLAQAEQLQEKVMLYERVPRLPVVFHDIRPQEYRTFNVAECFADAEKMLTNELLHAYVGVKYEDDRMLTVRAQFGPGIIPSLFGCKVEAVETTTWTEPFHDSEKIKSLVSHGIPDLHRALAEQVFERQQYFAQILRDFALDKHIHQYQADNQSPFDLAEMIWGEDIYIAMYEDPRLVHEFLDLLTETTIAFAKLQKPVLMEDPDTMYHWWYKVRGGIRCVDDMTTNISPDMYDEFVLPQNEKLYAAFQGGYAHYCGFQMHNQPGRIKTRGNNGMELVEDRFQNVTDHTFSARWSEMAPSKKTVYWIGYTLDDAARKIVNTGAVFGYSMLNEKPEDIPEKCQQIKDYWVL